MLAEVIYAIRQEMARTLADIVLRRTGFGTLGHPGNAKHVAHMVKKVSRGNGAMSLTGYATQKWERTRFTEPYMREDLQDYGIIIDTLESAITWEGFHRLHQEVRAFIKRRPNTICMTHASHFYPQGTNLYFIYIIKQDTIEAYLEFRAGIVNAIVDNGGSPSHHHGIGRLLAPWLQRHLGAEQMAVLKAVKKHFDPNGIMNPGAFGFD